VAVGAVVLGALAFGSPAQAHGAMSTPPSRSVVCGVGTPAQMNSAACKAAVAAGADVADWDNIRVSGVDGRDRQVIPDGKLCSGGLAKFAGLDLPRTDWPTTRLTAGATFTFAYKQRIPHRGTFRVYVTKDGFDPKRSLRWSDVETTPFLTVTDPSMRDNAYVMKGKLPARSGRHIIYTIWQNSSTADTYYSCSDVTLTAASSNGSPTKKPSSAAGAPLVPSREAQPTTAGPSLVPKAAQTKVKSPRTAIMLASGGVVLVAVAAGTFAATRRRPRPRHR
jgi:predicted carbohydrate-binding protein with CBM5 and CBM33 domain